MIGRSTSAFPYVLKADKENLDESKWTTWNIKPILPGQASKQFARITAAIVEKPGTGTREIKEGKFSRASFEAWMGVINSIENFCFAPEESDSQLPEVQRKEINELHKNGFIEKIDGDDEHMMKLVYFQLPGAEKQEILDAADELSIATVKIRKKSSSQRGTKSSSTTSQ